ncbi:hypothetical protein L6164_008523 [Bauhinia variegata]|uniref:Uncharacterized protein n=1 Tax=Bauhinia variegata TaxID=167791 RepID=A0ACB9PG59_BAUVA|nr:hypothetical protein L6164_008523 [Bauhinia variegata]
MMMGLVSVVLGGLLVLLFHFSNLLFVKPRLIRAKLRRQGINGPCPHFFLGNILEIRSIRRQLQSSAKSTSQKKGSSISHRWPSSLFPHMEKWRKQYGSICLYSTGSMQWLLVTDIEMVKEVSLCTSLNLGKPSYLFKSYGPLFGQGILSSSGPIWAHQRKIIAPELYLHKVKGMVNVIVDSTNIMLRSWETRLESEGGTVSEMKIDEDLRSLSADIIARACFGSNYTEGKEIFTKLRDLQKVISKITAGIPGFRYLPFKINKDMWRLEKEINSTISKLVKRRLEAAREKDLLQMILEGANSYEGSDGLASNPISNEKFIIDNCKNIFFAGHETTAITASWCLMLLAAHQDWQDRARAEVFEVCGNGPPDASVLGNMKTLTMVIQETLRLYPPAVFVTRTALKDIIFKDLQIPEGMNIQIPIHVLQQDPHLWGPDAHKFKPERFANGILGACKDPEAYIPFGVGARVCVGQQLARTELKVILSLILMKFHFSLSSSYQHSPIFGLVIEPGRGVILNIRRI